MDDEISYYQYQAYLWDIRELESRLTSILKDMDDANESIALACYIEAEYIRDEIKALERRIERFEYDAEILK